MDIADYEKEKARYVKLRANVVSIINYLKSFKVSIDDVKTKTTNKYTLNSENTPVLNRVNKVSKTSGEIRLYLNNTIIPAIDAAIKKCNAQITKLEAEAKKEETEKKEAAAKKAAAARTAIQNNSNSDIYGSSSTIY